MFPLLKREGANPLELFQIWLNLPAVKKFAQPHYAMLWSEDIPIHRVKDDQGKITEVRIIAGTFGEVSAPPPAPDSWAHDADNDVAIWIIKMQSHARCTIPATSPELNRALYFYRGSSIRAAGIDISSYQAVELFADQEVVLENGDSDSCCLLLQGHPIDEPVAHYGPFVMNTDTEIQKAISDYRKTQFGGWPWPRHDMVHDRSMGRFARYASGKEEIR
jgi:redox-sensitive bicupin YhaK (pirin superfamily)